MSISKWIFSASLLLSLTAFTVGCGSKPAETPAPTETAAPEAGAPTEGEAPAAGEAPAEDAPMTETP